MDSCLFHLHQSAENHKSVQEHYNTVHRGAGHGGVCQEDCMHVCTHLKAEAEATGPVGVRPIHIHTHTSVYSFQCFLVRTFSIHETIYRRLITAFAHLEPK